MSVPDENPSALGMFDFPLRFPGQYADKESGLFYNGYRDYDPALGAYERADPLGNVPYQVPSRRLNHPYAYADSNSLRNADPLGLCPCPGGIWDQELGDFQFSIGIGGYVSIGNVNYICRSNHNLKCSGRQTCIGAGTPNIGVSWALGGVQYGANNSGDLGGWSVDGGIFSGWNLGVQGAFFQGQLSLSGQGGSTAIGLPRGFGVSLTRCFTNQLKCSSCPTCPPQGVQQ
jgi:RHS repeat-associated protein